MKLEYFVIIQGIVICGLLSWEILMLKKLYSVLQNTSDSMDKMITSITKVVDELKKTNLPLASLLQLFNGAKK